MEKITDRSSDGWEAETRDKASNFRRELDEESTAVLSGNSEEIFNRGAKVLDKITNGGSLVDNAADGITDTSETEAVKETSNRRRKLDQEGLGVFANDVEKIINARSEVLEKVAAGLFITFDVVAEGSDDLTNGLSEAGEETGEQTLDFRGESDEESADTLAGDSEEVIGGFAEVLEEITDVGSLLDDLANGNANLG